MAFDKRDDSLKTLKENDASVALDTLRTRSVFSSIFVSLFSTKAGCQFIYSGSNLGTFFNCATDYIIFFKKKFSLALIITT